MVTAVAVNVELKSNAPSVEKSIEDGAVRIWTGFRACTDADVVPV
jgi:hypothetical protein